MHTNVATALLDQIKVKLIPYHYYKAKKKMFFT